MPTVIKMWEVTGSVLQPVAETTLPQDHKTESQLEGWIAADPQVIADGVMIIDRQRDIPGVGRLDLLGIDEDGTLVIIELKRDRAPREAVAQALDYASWLDSADGVEIRRNANEFLKDKGPFEQAFKDYFDLDEVPVISGESHRILLVAARLDASAERIISYLSMRRGIDINAVFFQYSRLSDGKQIIARTTLVAEGAGTGGGAGGGRRPRPTVEGLLAAANEHGVAPLVEVCRNLGDQFEEGLSCGFGGSFRYFTTNAAGKRKFVFGVAIPGELGPPQGQLDVWVPVRGLANVAGRTEDEIRALLAQHQVLEMRGQKNRWIRLTSEAQAEALVTQLRALATHPIGPNA
jgi:hypothetical protein